MRVLVMMAVVLVASAGKAVAQTDEIQVYDAEIEELGKFNVMVHSNFAPIGRTMPDFPGGIIPNHSVNGAVEWAYGVTDWFEQGLYFPVYTAYSEDRGGSLNGFKLRELFVRPHAHDQTFFYGVNFEFSVNYTYWEPKRFTSEVRPIIGVHLHPVDIIFNPIVDTDYTGFWQPRIRPGDAHRLQRERQMGDRRRGICRYRSPASLLRRPRPVSRGLGGHGSRDQGSEYRDRRGGRGDRRRRQVDVQADAVA